MSRFPVVRNIGRDLAALRDLRVRNGFVEAADVPTAQLLVTSPARIME